jgi:hypothetical protein
MPGYGVVLEIDFLSCYFLGLLLDVRKILSYLFYWHSQAYTFYQVRSFH